MTFIIYSAKWTLKRNWEFSRRTTVNSDKIKFGQKMYVGVSQITYPQRECYWMSEGQFIKSKLKGEV